MLATLFPWNVPGRAPGMSRTPEYRTDVYESPGGYRSTVSWRSVPRYLFSIKFAWLRDTENERTALEDLFDDALGAAEDFLLVDPWDDKVRKVHFDADDLPVTRIIGGVHEASCRLVSGAVGVSLAVTPDPGALTHPDTQQFTATLIFSDGDTLNVTALCTWESSDPTNATIDAEGLATTVSTGTTDISASLGDLDDTVVLTVS
jgi:hypothetical protein